LTRSFFSKNQSHCSVFKDLFLPGAFCTGKNLFYQVLCLFASGICFPACLSFVCRFVPARSHSTRFVTMFQVVINPWCFVAFFLRS